MSLAKENFLRTKLISILQRLDPSTKPHWGKMNVHQMIEHLAKDGFAIASGRRVFTEFVTPEAHLPKYKEFLVSDKPFKENTVSPILPSEPQPVSFNTIQSAINYLQEELIAFFEVFEKNPSLQTRNPIFGDLNFEENVQLLVKHSLHHLKQFGVEVIL